MTPEVQGLQDSGVPDWRTTWGYTYHPRNPSQEQQQGAFPAPLALFCLALLFLLSFPLYSSLSLFLLFISLLSFYLIFLLFLHSCLFLSRYFSCSFFSFCVSVPHSFFLSPHFSSWKKKYSPKNAFDLILSLCLHSSMPPIHPSLSSLGPAHSPGLTPLPHAPSPLRPQLSLDRWEGSEHSLFKTTFNHRFLFLDIKAGA